VLLDEDGSCEAEQGRGVGEHAHYVGAAFDLFVESFGFVDQICRQCLGGKLQNARISARASWSILATLGWVRSSIRVTSSNWAWTCFASGWAKMVRMTAATMSWLARGTIESTFLMK
jgi:hypothetical protein